MVAIATMCTVYMHARSDRSTTTIILLFVARRRFHAFEKNDLDRRADGNGEEQRGKKTKRSLMARNARYGRELSGVTVICAFFRSYSPPATSLAMDPAV